MFSLTTMLFITGVLIVGFVIVQKVYGPLPNDLKKFKNKRRK